LSKTMPFRAKEVDQLLKQVVKGKFSFRPEERWRHVSAEAKDLISKLLVVDASQRCTISQVRDHPWAREAIMKCEADLPKLDAENKARAKTAVSSLFRPSMLVKMSSAGTRLGKPAATSAEAAARRAERKNKKSREQQYWYAMEISPPTNMQQQSGVKVSEDGTFQMDNVPKEMRAVLADIQKMKESKKIAACNVASRDGSSLGAADEDEPSALACRMPCLPGASISTECMLADVAGEPRGREMAARMSRLQLEHEVNLRHQSQAEAVDTMILIKQKDDDIASLQHLVAAKVEQVETLQRRLEQAVHEVAPSPSSCGTLPGDDDATRRADVAEAKAAELQAMNTKLQAKLTAVSTLYTEAMQREAILKLELEHLKRDR